MGYFKNILTESSQSRSKVLTNDNPIIDIEAGSVDKYNADYIAFNNDVANWGKNVKQKLQGSIRRLSTKGKGELVKSLRMKTHQNYGLTERISFTFERHGAYWHKGVGRGYAAQGEGRVLRIPAGKSKVLTSSTINRHPVEWFNPIIDENIDKLANIVVAHMANATVNATKMKIN